MSIGLLYGPRGQPRGFERKENESPRHRPRCLSTLYNPRGQARDSKEKRITAASVRCLSTAMGPVVKPRDSKKEESPQPRPRCLCCYVPWSTTIQKKKRITAASTAVSCWLTLWAPWSSSGDSKKENESPASTAVSVAYLWRVKPGVRRKTIARHRPRCHNNAAVTRCHREVKKGESAASTAGVYWLTLGPWSSRRFEKKERITAARPRCLLTTLWAPVVKPRGFEEKKTNHHGIDRGVCYFWPRGQATGFERKRTITAASTAVSIGFTL